MKQFDVNVNPLIKKLELISKKGISGMLSGEFRSVFKGSGLEFSGFRVYNPGQDDAKNIDWKASLRSRNLLVKELVEERNNNVLFMIDVSSTMSFGSVPKLKNEYAIEMFASMAYALIQGGDAVGLALFSDRVRAFRTPNIGAKHFYVLLRTITNPELYEGVIDFKRVLQDINASMVRRSIIVLISDFISMGEGWEEVFKIISVKHELIVFVVNDIRDEVMPAEVGQVYVRDPCSGQELLIETGLVKEDYERLMHDRNTHLEDLFKRLRVDYLFLTTDKPFNTELYKFFKTRNLKR